MEMNVKEELLHRCSDLIGDVSWARTMAEDGKEVHCHRKLQGIMAKLLAFVEFAKIIPDDINMEISEENVAETNS